MRGQDKERQGIFSKNLKELIKGSGKTLPQIAGEMNVHQSQIYAYTNATYLPNVIVLIRLCKIFKCSYEDLLGPVDTQSSK